MLVIKDIVLNKEMTKQAMTAVFGGRHYCGNYDHTHSGRWRVRGYRAFYKIIHRGGRRYLALQRQWTLLRYQVRHVGRLYYVRRYS